MPSRAAKRETIRCRLSQTHRRFADRKAFPSVIWERENNPHLTKKSEDFSLSQGSICSRTFLLGYNGKKHCGRGCKPCPARTKTVTISWRAENRCPCHGQSANPCRGPPFAAPSRCRTTSRRAGQKGLYHCLPSRHYHQ